MLTARLASVTLLSLAVGCASTQPTSHVADELKSGDAIRHDEPSAAPSRDVAAAPAAVSSMEGYVVRRDVYDVASIEVQTVRRNGALFAASSRAAMAEQRPRAACRLIRTRYDPRAGRLRIEDSYRVEVLQPPLAPFQIDEVAARAVSEMANEPGPGGPATRPGVPEPVGSQVVVDDVRFIAFDGADARLLVVRSPDGSATFDRPSFQSALRAALAMIDGFRQSPR